MKFRQPLTIWLMILVFFPAIPLLVYSGYTVNQYANDRNQFLESTLEKRTDELADTYKAYFDGLEKQLSVLAVSNAAINNDVPGLYAFAQRFQSQSDELTAISLVDANNNLVFLTSAPLGTKLAASSLASVHEVFRTGQPNISGVFHSPIRDTQLYALNVPILKDGKVIYCLRGVFRLEILGRLLPKGKYPVNWIAALVDHDKLIAGRNVSPEKFIGQPASAGAQQAIQNHTKEAWTGVTVEGLRTISYARPVGKWHWSVVMGVTQDTLLQPLRTDLQKQLLAFAVVTLVTIALATFLGRTISRHLQRIGLDAKEAIYKEFEPDDASTGISELDTLRESLVKASIYRQAIQDEVIKRTNKLVDLRKELMNYVRHQDELIESERLRISRTVEEQIGAILTGISMSLHDVPQATLSQEKRAALQEALTQGLMMARRLKAELRPPALDDAGLDQAVKKMVAARLSGSGIACTVDLQDEILLSSRQRLGCYRILNEAVTQVLSHDKVTKCVIVGEYTHDHRYVICISDNGQRLKIRSKESMDSELISMQLRSEILGAQLDILDASENDGMMRISLPIE